MEIRCENCGCTNQFGTIFCRNCGKKLKVQDISAMSRQSSMPKKVFKRIFQVIITLLVIGTLCGLFLPVGFRKMPVYEGTAKDLENNIKGFKTAMSRGQTRTFILSPEELVAMIETIGKEERKAYRERPNKKNSDPEIPEPEGIFGLVVNDDNTLTAIYEKDFAAAVPFRMTLTGEPLLKKGTATLKATAATMGHISVPESLLPDVQEKFAEYMKERLSASYFDVIEEVKVKDGKISIRLKKDESKGSGFGDSGGFSGGKNFGSKFGGSSFGGGDLKSGKGNFGK